MRAQKVTTHSGTTVSVDPERPYSTFLRIEQGPVTIRLPLDAAEQVYELLDKALHDEAGILAAAEPCEQTRAAIARLEA